MTFNREAHQQQNDPISTDSVPSRRKRCSCGAFLSKKPTLCLKVSGSVNGVAIVMSRETTRCGLCGKSWEEDERWD